MIVALPRLFSYLFWMIPCLGIIQRSFKTSKNKKKRSNLISPLQKLRKYNSLFNITELKDAIAISKDTATGPDDIHYQMLKHLPETALDTLLHIFNGIWTTAVFSRKLAFGHNYTYSQTRERPCRTNKLQSNSANKLPLQNTRENDKQTTCLVLRI